MGKYLDSQFAFFNVFDSADWKRLEFKVVPTNYENTGNDEYLRITVLNTFEGINIKSSSGTVKIDIFTRSHEGPTRAREIADTLDDFFASKVLESDNSNVQTGKSVLEEIGIDSVNPSLYRHLYSLPFNNYWS